MTQEEMEDLFGDSNPFSDFFTTFFGGGMGGDVRGSAGGRGGGVRQRPGRDIENEIELSLRRRLQRHDAAARLEPRRASPHGRRAFPGRSRDRVRVSA
jgi:DnaJ-class molecular chaperone